MGHAADSVVEFRGAGTVRMGRCVKVDTGGWVVAESWRERGGGVVVLVVEVEPSAFWD